MTQKPTHEVLREVFAVIVDKVRQDPEFGAAVLSALRQGALASAPPDAVASKPIIAKKPKTGSAHDAAGAKAGRRRRGGETPTIAKPRLKNSKSDKPLTQSRIAALIAENGRRGAQAALLKTRITRAELRACASDIGVDLSQVGGRRRDLIDALIAGAPHSRADAFG